MDLIKDEYKLRLEQDDEGININLYINGETSPLIYLQLKPLNEVDTSLDDKLVVRDIPRHLFLKGDYYQSSVAKHTTAGSYKKISLLSIIHEILVENKEELNILNNIYSTSFNFYREECFITVDAERFWKKQLEKSPSVPVDLFNEDNRYKLTINLRNV